MDVALGICRHAGSDARAQGLLRTQNTPLRGRRTRAASEATAIADVDDPIVHAGGFVEGPDSSAIDILGSGPRTRARVIKAARKAPGERGEVHVNTGVVQHIDHVFPGAGQARISAIIADQIMTGDHVPELDAGILDEGL